MLSVVERIDIVADAEELAGDRDYLGLVDYLEGVPRHLLNSDPTLEYLLAYGKYMIGNELQAREYLSRVTVKVSDTTGRLYRRVLNLRAILEIELGSLSTADLLLTNLQVSAERAGDTRYVGYSTLNKAIVQDILGYPYRAIALLERARTAFQVLGDQAAIAGCEHNLGMFFRRTNHYEVAEAHFAAAADYFGKHGSTEEATATVVERALALLMAGETAIAISTAWLAHKTAIALGNIRLQAEASRVLGIASHRRGDTAAARQLLTDALSIATSSGLRLLRAEVLVELATVAKATGNYSEAESMTRRSAAMFSDMGATSRSAEVLSGLPEAGGLVSSHE